MIFTPRLIQSDPNVVVSAFGGATIALAVDCNELLVAPVYVSEYDEPDTASEPFVVVLPAWFAVMVVVPAPTMLTRPPVVTVATVGVLLVYVNAPLLSVVGAVNENAAAPKILAGTLNTPMVGAICETTNAADTDLDVKFPDAS